MWSSNLYKAGWVRVGDETRVIDSNEQMKARLKQAEAEGYRQRVSGGEDVDGFTTGLDVTMVDALLDPDGEGTVLKAGASQMLSGEMEKLKQEIEQARAELLQVQDETAQTIRDAEAQIEVMRRKTLDEASHQGFQEGYQKGMAQVQAMKDECQARAEELEAEYQRRIEELEPEFVDALTGIYEHIFKVDLSGYEQIVLNLLVDAMQKTDSASSYIIHVSKKDYPLVMKQKDRILEETGNLEDSLEIISDLTLSGSQCLIETEAGVYDCSLDTELKELGRKLKLLSYKR